MKRLLSVLLAVLLLIPSAAAFTEVPQFSSTLFECGKQALVYLASGEYERLVTLLPFSDVSPSAAEWQSFAEGNFSSLSDGVQTEYAVAYWTGFLWKLAIPVSEPSSGEVETLVLTSADGVSFTGYRYSTWGDVRNEYLYASYVTWDKEYIGGTPFIAAD